MQSPIERLTVKAPRSTIWLLFCAAVALAGCKSERAPSFVSSDDVKELAPAAQEKVFAELTATFGTPTQLVATPALNVDYGRYTGTVRKALEQQGTLLVYLKASSNLASDDRLEELSGSAVVLASSNEATEGEAAEGEEAADEESEAAPTYLVESFSLVADTPGTENGRLGKLVLVDESGEPAAVSVEENDTLTITGDGLQHGRNLYLRHCMHCHGVSGDGAGPTAEYFTIKPRDYRKGIFKFKSTSGEIRASRDDLYRMIKLGAPGTYMPSFMLLPDSEVHALVEYVRWLSMRGQMEGKYVTEFGTGFPVSRLEEEDEEAIAKEFAEFWDENKSDLREFIQGDIVNFWTESEDEANIVWPKADVLDEKGAVSEKNGKPAPRTPPTSESILNGRKLFMNKDKGNCFSCHGETARGNGVSTETLTDKTGQPGVKNEKPGLYDDWGHLVKPRDLTSGIYRGGRRPIDIYRRIHTGIKGTPMQAFGGTLKSHEIWDIVNYVLSIPVTGAEPPSQE